MPVPSPVLYPPFNVVRLSHVELAVTNLAASRRFYADLLGLQVTHEDAGAIHLLSRTQRPHMTTPNMKDIVKTKYGQAAARVSRGESNGCSLNPCGGCSKNARLAQVRARTCGVP